MRWIKWLFYLAGIYGVLVLTPLYFKERALAEAGQPAITYPEFFYGFVGVALAWQVAFLIIGGDPVRFRPIILAGIVEKLSFGIAAPILYVQQRVKADMLAAGFLDLVLGVLFMIAWVQLGKKPAASDIIAR